MCITYLRYMRSILSAVSTHTLYMFRAPRFVHHPLPLSRPVDPRYRYPIGTCANLDTTEPGSRICMMMELGKDLGSGKAEALIETDL